MEYLTLENAGIFGASFVAFIAYIMPFIKNLKLIATLNKVKLIWGSVKSLDEFLNDPVVKHKIDEHFDDKTEALILDVAEDLEKIFKSK